jgi:hypothetical protein
MESHGHGMELVGEEVRQWVLKVHKDIKEVHIGSLKV